MPPPPPPPPAPPLGGGRAAVPPNLGGSGQGSSPSDRNALLKSIQSGKKLRPTVTNDRSAPQVNGGGAKQSSKPVSDTGKSDDHSSGSSHGRGGGGGGGGPLPGIGGLFSNGMPTLRKTQGGVSTGRVNAAKGISNVGNHHLKNNTGASRTTSGASSLNSSPSLSSSSPSTVSSTPTHSSSSLGATAVKPINAPPPPPPSVKPGVPNSSKPTSGGMSSGGRPHPMSKPPPPPIGGRAVSKESEFSSNGRLAAARNYNQTIGHGPQGRPQIIPQQKASRDDMNIRNGQIGTPPPPPVRTVSQSQQPTPVRQPSRAPPPPPPQHKRPSQPPPPPPSNPPPPPLSSSSPAPTKALPPPPPSSQDSSDPPTPPTRKESYLRSSTGAGLTPSANQSNYGGDSFEARFAGRFKTMQFLPPPEPFSGCQKTYPSKNTLPARQGSQMKRTPAPPPPPGKPPMGPVCPPPGKPPLPPTHKPWHTQQTGVL